MSYVAQIARARSASVAVPPLFAQIQNSVGSHMGIEGIKLGRGSSSMISCVWYLHKGPISSS